MRGSDRRVPWVQKVGLQEARLLLSVSLPANPLQ
jgi:hypothetical protein